MHTKLKSGVAESLSAFKKSLKFTSPADKNGFRLATLFSKLLWLSAEHIIVFFIKHV